MSSEFWNRPPTKVFLSGSTMSRGKNMTIKWPPFLLPSNRYYVALYFQDNRSTSPYSWRVFTVFIDGETFYQDLNVTTKGVTVYGTEWPLSGETEIVLSPRSDMLVGPTINAGEVYQILPLGGTTLGRDGTMVILNSLNFVFLTRYCILKWLCRIITYLVKTKRVAHLISRCDLLLELIRFSFCLELIIICVITSFFHMVC